MKKPGASVRRAGGVNVEPLRKLPWRAAAFELPQQVAYKLHPIVSVHAALDVAEHAEIALKRERA